jgi:hypothetical protein
MGALRLRGLTPLWLIGAVSALVYWLAFTARFPLAERYGELADLASLGGKDEMAALKYLGPIVGLFLLYGLALRFARGRCALLPTYAGAVAFGTIAVFEYPITAIDLFVYLVDGRLWTRHSANPMVVPPNAFPGDPFNHLAGQYVYTPAPYGPVWIVLAGLPSLLFGDELYHSVLALKALALLAYLGCAAAIGWILWRVDPETAATGTLFFAWNPLVVLDGVGNGHNDAVMMLPALVGLGLVMRGRELPGLAFLALAAAVKYSVAVLIPVVFLHHVRHWTSPLDRLRYALVAGVFAVGVFLVCYAPFWAGPDTFAGLLKRNDIVVGSVAALVNHFRRELAPDVPQSWVAYLFTAGFVLLYGWLLVGVWRGRRGWLPTSFEVLFAAMFAPVWFNSWFVIWPLAVAALLPDRRARWLIGVMSATVMFGAFFFYFGPVWNSGGWDVPKIHLLAVPAIFGPPLLLTLWPSGTRRAFPHSAEREVLDAATP